jgi:hypothetical protein
MHKQEYMTNINFSSVYTYTNGTSLYLLYKRAGKNVAEKDFAFRKIKYFGNVVWGGG